MATLTRGQMEQAIREGGSVLYGGQVITRIDHLPSEAELAKGDADKEAAAASDLQALIDALQAQLASLQTKQDAQPESEQAADSLLPDDFPFVAELRAAGFTGADQVRSASDKQLASVSGIDKEAIKQIRAALDAA